MKRTQRRDTFQALMTRAHCKHTAQTLILEAVHCKRTPRPSALRKLQKRPTLEDLPLKVSLKLTLETLIRKRRRYQHFHTQLVHALNYKKPLARRPRHMRIIMKST